MTLLLFPALRTQGAVLARDAIRAADRLLAGESAHHIDLLTHTLAGLRPGWRAAAAEEFEAIAEITAARERLRAKTAPVTPAAITPVRYQVSSLFLAECWRYLRADPSGRERLHLVTGSITADAVRVLSRMEQVTYAKQSAAYVAADPAATHRQVVDLVERDGHALLAMFHFHPMIGAASTRPSATDLTNQERFAAIGWDALAGIFSRDGFARLFSTVHDFELDLYGNRATLIEDGPREKLVQLDFPAEV